MQAHWWQSGAADQRLQVLGNLPGPQRAAVLTGEDTARVLPAGVPRCALQQLASLPVQKYVSSALVDGQDPVAALALDVAADVELAGGQVNVGPLHPVQLTAPKPPVRGQVIQRVQPVVRHRCTRASVHSSGRIFRALPVVPLAGLVASALH